MNKFVPSVHYAPDPRDQAYTFEKHFGAIGEADIFARSANYAIGPILDQGFSQECLAFGMAGLMACEPFSLDVGNPDRLYAEMCAIDGRVHEPDDTGSNLGAALKVCQRRGYFNSYLWCQAATDIWRFLTDPEHGGPVGIAIPWFPDMELLRDDGTLDVPLTMKKENVEGGHFMYISGCRRDMSAPTRKMRLRCNNSRSVAWGDGGRCDIDFPDMSRLLAFGSLAVAPTKAKFNAK